MAEGCPVLWTAVAVPVFVVFWGFLGLHQRTTHCWLRCCDLVSECGLCLEFDGLGVVPDFVVCWLECL